MVAITAMVVVGEEDTEEEGEVMEEDNHLVDREVSEEVTECLT